MQNSNYYERFKLFSIPFTFQSDGSIVISYKIDNLSQIEYSYSKSYYEGNASIYTSSNTSFTKFLPPLDSATISIVIREWKLIF